MDSKADRAEGEMRDRAIPAARRDRVTEASPTTTESTSTRTMPLYRVLLHNDPVNTMEHVVTTLVQIFGLQIEAAIQIMLEAHNSEVALCKVEPLEPAELHRDQLQAAGLTATVEKES